MISKDTMDWHRQAAERDAAYLALGPVDDTETTDGPWSGSVSLDDVTDLMPPQPPLWWAEIFPDGELTWGRVGSMWSPSAGAGWCNFYAADDAAATPYPSGGKNSAVRLEHWRAP